MVTRLLKNERGIALLAVLMGIALMTLLVVDFATSAEYGFMSAANQANELRAYYLARSGVSVGLAVLAKDAQTKAIAQQMGGSVGGFPPDSLGDSWASPYPPVKVGGGQFTLSIVDENRKINLNAMIGLVNGAPAVNQKAIAQVGQLLQIVFTEQNIDADPATLTHNILQWIAPAGMNLQGTGGGLNLGFNSALQPRGGPMPTIGDLMLVPGFNEAIFHALLPFVAALPITGQQPGVNAPPPQGGPSSSPTPTPIASASSNGCLPGAGVQVNINTAPPEVIAALEPGLMQNPDLVKELVLARAAAGPLVPNQPGSNTSGYSSPWSAITTAMPCLSQDVFANGQSQYFTITGVGTFAGSRKIVRATFSGYPPPANRGLRGFQGNLISWREL
ncbi:MAG: general secretion pathway protein GspK [Candidatus Binataceae bacterium]